MSDKFLKLISNKRSTCVALNPSSFIYFSTLSRFIGLYAIQSCNQDISIWIVQSIHQSDQKLVMLLLAIFKLLYECIHQGKKSKKSFSYFSY